MKKVLVALAAALIAGAAVYFLVRATEPAPEAASTATETATETMTATSTNSLAGTSTAASAVSPVSPGVSAAFAERLKSEQAALPTTAAIETLPAEEKHHTPKVMLEAGLELGRIAEAIQRDPSLAPEGLEFFDRCAKRDELALPVRATCLSRLRDLAKATGTQVDESGISPELARLVKKISD